MSTPLTSVALVSDDLLFRSQLDSVVRGLGRTLLGARQEPASADAVFIDLNTSVEERLNLIQRLRQDRPELPLIGFCHHLEKVRRQEAMSRGATMVITNGAVRSAAHRLLTGEAAEPHAGWVP